MSLETVTIDKIYKVCFKYYVRYNVYDKYNPIEPRHKLVDEILDIIKEYYRNVNNR